jgi:hypothetical protein
MVPVAQRSEGMSAPSWAEIDTFRSIWEAIAIVNGDDPEVAVEGHRRLCRMMGWEPAETTAECA